METQTPLERTSADEMLCPACNARQAWSDECRRCKCDLSLLRRFQRTCATHHRRCLQALDDGHPDQALHHARRYAALVGKTPDAHLVAVCHLLSGNWELAMHSGRV